MKRFTKVAGISGACYFALWLATALTARPALERQLRDEVMAQWKASLPAQAAASIRYPGQTESMAFKEGPSARVNLLSCLAPLVFRAECSRMIGGLNGYGTVGVYLLTPWRVYLLSETQTWIS